MPLTKIDLIEMIYGELNIPKKEIHTTPVFLFSIE